VCFIELTESAFGTATAVEINQGPCFRLVG